MSRLEDCCTRCDVHGCRTTVCLDDDPAALRPCGHVICDRCTFCDECPDPAPCCPDPDCDSLPCTFPGYADNH